MCWSGCMLLYFKTHVWGVPSPAFLGRVKEANIWFVPSLNKIQSLTVTYGMSCRLFITH